MKLLVTGGAGFIGSNFIRYILQQYKGYSVVNLDKLTYAGNLDNLEELANQPRYIFEQGDIGDQKLVDRIVKQYAIEVIIHFAAESHVDRSIVDPNLFTVTNIIGTQVLLNAAKEYSVRKFVQISTDEVYGSLGEHGYCSEDAQLAPNSPYSASKAGADLIVRAYHKTYGMNMNIIRSSNNYGPYQHPEKLIPLMISCAIRNKPLPVYGNGMNVRDWLHVADHVSAIDLVIHQGEAGEVYNIGGHNERRNIEIAELIAESLNKPKSLIHFVEDRKGHDMRYAVDSTKAERQLGWKPIHTFQTGMRETIQWYVDNQAWWERRNG